MLVVTAILITSFITAAIGQASATVVGRCEDSEAYRSNTTVFMIDKTTDLSDKDKLAWRSNASHLFDDASIYGRVILVEIKDSSVSFTVSAPYCIPPAKDFIQPEITQLVPKFEWRWVWIRENLVPYLWLALEEAFKAIVSALSPNPYQGIDPVEQNATQRLVIARARVRAAVVDLVSLDKESPSTDIIDPLFNTVSVYCSEQKNCRLYVFSDFIDSKLSGLIKRGSPNTATNSADIDFDRLNHEYLVNLKSTKLSIIAWGIGRDEVAPGTALSPSQRATLRQYWSTMFRRFCTSASPYGSSVSLTDIFSASGGRGC